MASRIEFLMNGLFYKADQIKLPDACSSDTELLSHSGLGWAIRRRNNTSLGIVRDAWGLIAGRMVQGILEIVIPISLCLGSG